MSKKFYFTFKEDYAFRRCLQPVYANNKEQAIRLMTVVHGDGWDEAFDEQGGRVIKDNEGYVELEELGLE